MGRKNYKAIGCLCLILASCVKDKPPVAGGHKLSGSGNVYVVCEGNFNSGHGTLYVYDKHTDSVFGDLYKSVNSQQLGDVFQSMTKIGDRYFLCVNNSDKLVAVNASDLTLAGSLRIAKPRYILAVSATKAYVTSEYSNKVYVLDPQQIVITDSLVLPFVNTEGMCLYNSSAFICTWDTGCNAVYKVDVSTNKIVQTIKVAGYAPQEAILDKEQMLWVLSGDQPPPYSKTCALTRLDPSTGDVLASYVFPAAADAFKPVFNASRDTLYFIEADYFGGISYNGIYRMGIHEATLPSQPFVAGRSFQNFWAVGVDPETGLVFIGDPKGFNQKGVVYVYRTDGIAVDSFAVGEGPGHFLFE